MIVNSSKGTGWYGNFSVATKPQLSSVDFLSILISCRLWAVSFLHLAVECMLRAPPKTDVQRESLTSEYLRLTTRDDYGGQASVHRIMDDTGCYLICIFIAYSLRVHCGFSGRVATEF